MDKNEVRAVYLEGKTATEIKTRLDAVLGNASPSFTTPYAVITESVIIKKDSSSIGTIVSQVQNGGTDNAKINVNVSIIQDMPSSIMMQIYTKRLSNSIYISIGIPIQKSFCTFVKEDRLLYPGFLNSGNFPKACPIKKGQYYMKNYVVDTENFPPVLPSGKYRLNLLISNHGKTLFDIEWTGHVKNNN